MTVQLPTSVNEWLYFLEHRHADVMQLGLERVSRVAKALNLLETGSTVITVAGTNGKGSTVAALESIYTQAGYKVGAYTSPHLIYFNERIRINSVPVDDERLCEAFSYIEHHRGDTDLTYFEVATLASLWIFKQLRLDVVLLEVGLGGRLDATNIVDADLAVITTIDYDHQSVLGDTIEAIGYEKAGILRPNQRFIYADINPPHCILERSLELNTSFHCLGTHYDFHVTDDTLVIKLYDGSNISLAMPSIHPQSAAASVVASKLIEPNLPLTTDHIISGINLARNLGRTTLIKTDKIILLDVAHNVQAARYLSNVVKQLKSNQQVHCVFAALNDKDVCGLIDTMNHLVDIWYPALLDTSRAATAKDMEQAFAKAINLGIICYNCPFEAYQSALKRAVKGDIIVVFGSFFTVSSVMTHAKLPIQEEVIV